VGVLKAYGIPAKRAPKDLMDAVRRVADEEKVALKEYYIPTGMATDLMPIRRAGYRGIDFIGMAGASHTTADRIGLVIEAALGDYVKVGLGVVMGMVGEREKE